MEKFTLEDLYDFIEDSKQNTRPEDANLLLTIITYAIGLYRAQNKDNGPLPDVIKRSAPYLNKDHLDQDIVHIYSRWSAPMNEQAMFDKMVIVIISVGFDLLNRSMKNFRVSSSMLKLLSSAAVTDKVDPLDNPEWLEWINRRMNSVSPNSWTVTAPKCLSKKWGNGDPIEVSYQSLYFINDSEILDIVERFKMLEKIDLATCLSKDG